MKETYRILTDTSKMDINLIHGYLSKTSYWAKGRSKALVQKSMENSLCFGAFSLDGKQIGFARVATDYVVFAWLMDVFVIEELQGQGIGQQLIQAVIDHPDLQNVNGMGLRTGDAHGFYKNFGFDAIPKPEMWMFKKNN